MQPSKVRLARHLVRWEASVKEGATPRVALSSEGFLVVDAREGLHAIGWMSDIWMVLVWAFKVPVTFTFWPVNFFAFSELSK